MAVVTLFAGHSGLLFRGANVRLALRTSDPPKLLSARRVQPSHCRAGRERLAPTLRAGVTALGLRQADCLLKSSYENLAPAPSPKEKGIVFNFMSLVIKFLQLETNFPSLLERGPRTWGRAAQVAGKTSLKQRSG